MRKILLIFAMCFALLSSAYAQQTVSGTVTDEDGIGIPGASIIQKGTSNGTITNVDGNYTFSVPADATIVISFVGMTKVEELVDGRSQIDVTLTTDAIGIDEVVVTALGIKRAEKSLGFAAQSVKGEEIAQSTETNAFNALKGKVAGVQIMDGNGVEGSTTRINIRGNSSLVNGKNQPLVIVDGVAIENSITGAGANSWGSQQSGKDWGSGINDINPWDIADMSVLKGPAGAALYGSRGANGVIIITTKKGNKSDGLGVDVNVSHTYTQATRFKDKQEVRGGGTVSYYENVIMDGDDNHFQPVTIDGVTYNQIPSTSFWGSGASWGPEILDQPILWWDGTVQTWSRHNNMKEFLKTGFNKSYNVAVSNSDENGSVRLSMTRRNTEAITPNTESNNTTIALNISQQITSKIRLDAAVSYIHNYQFNSPQLGSSENSIGKRTGYSGYVNHWLMYEADRWEYPDGSKAPAGKGRPGIDELAGYPANYRGLGRGGSFFWNLMAKNQERQTDRLIGSASLNWDITPWLAFKGTLGIDYKTLDIESRNRPTDSEGLTGGRYSHSVDKNKIENHMWMFTLNKELTDDLHLTAFVNGEHYSREYYYIQGRNGNRNFVDPHLYTFDNLALPVDDNGRVSGSWALNNLNANENILNKTVNSLAGSINLSYKEFLFLDITGRNDWSSTLPEEGRSYFYPSVQTAFVFTEAFDIGWDALSFGKVRVAYSMAGNDTAPYQLTPTFSKSTFLGMPTGAVATTIPPQTLRNEISHSYDFGLDLRFFNGRLSGDFSYYQIKSTQQIMSAPLPTSSGFGSFKFNTGEVENKGWELLLSGTPVQNKDLTWDVTLNLTANKNKVNALAPGATTLGLGGFYGANGPSIEARPGEEYGSIMGWDYTYFDSNGNGETDGSERTPENRLLDANGKYYELTQDKVVVGNVTPKLLGGLVNTVSWKGLSLNVILDFRYGGDVVYGSMSAQKGMGQSPSTLKGWNAEHGGLAWTDDNGLARNDGIIKVGKLPDGTKNTAIYPYYVEHWDIFSWGKGLVTPTVFETSYIAIQEVSLTYNLPQSILSKVGFLKNGSITLIGRDLGFLKNTAPDNMNPTGVNGISNAQGVELEQLPGVSTYGVTLRTSF